jgi:hypothetical protein
MSSEKIKKIKEAGWEVGDIDLFLSPDFPQGRLQP